MIYPIQADPDQFLGEHSDIEIYGSPWVCGTRADAYFGPVTAALFLVDGAVANRSESWEKAEREVMEAMRDKARALGANSIVDFSMSIDPFAQIEGSGPTGVRLFALGTAARLRSLF